MTACSKDLEEHKFQSGSVTMQTQFGGLLFYNPRAFVYKRGVVVPQTEANSRTVNAVELFSCKQGEEANGRNDIANSRTVNAVELFSCKQGEEANGRNDTKPIQLMYLLYSESERKTQFTKQRQFQ